MKPTKTPQEKFKAGLKKSGYDPDAGAKRLLDLIAKQKKEREEFESKYKSAYEGREMKTLKQIVEGTVVMTDFKLDKKGRRYKAHRTTMGRDVRMTNEEGEYPHVGTGTSTNMEMARDIARMNAKSEMMKSIHGGNYQDKTPPTYEEDKLDMKPDGKGNFVATVRIRQKAEVKEAKDPREYDYEGDMAKSQLRSIMANAKQVHDMLKDDTNMAEWVQSKITLSADYISTVADYMQAEVNEEVEQVFEGATKINQQSGSDRAFDVIHKDSDKKIGTVYTPGKTNPNHVATVNGLDGRPGKTGEFKSFKEAHMFITASHPLTRDLDEEVEQVDELKKATIQSYLKKKTTTPGVPSQKDVSGMARASMRLMGKGPMSEDADFDELDEARGRPAGAATLAKRAVAAAAAKPRHDDDEGDQYDPDSGVEADQHIHVQLKKAADSDQKPFEVSFRNGKKHTVSQKVAKDILGATDRLKPEHRKNVHDEIHQSYDNLMSVHRLVAGR